MFILTVNMIGLIPYTFTVTSHIIVTIALALTVFLTVLIYGLYRHGLHFFNLFVPKGVPIYILPLIVFIEVLSFVSRPISHSVRLFANMLAGHITLQVFAGFIVLMGGAMGALGWAGGRAAVRHDRHSLRAGGRWWRSCRLTFSPFSPASISTMRFTRAIKARPDRAEGVSYGSSGSEIHRCGHRLHRHGRRRRRRRHHLRQLFGGCAAQSVRRSGPVGNLIFGFAITEALGIFSLLIALLLLFAL